MEATCLAWPGQRQMHLSGAKGGAGLLGPMLAQQRIGGRPRGGAPSLGSPGSQAVIEVLGSSKHLHWSVPDSWAEPM